MYQQEELPDPGDIFRPPKWLWWVTEFPTPFLPLLLGDDSICAPFVQRSGAGKILLQDTAIAQEQKLLHVAICHAKGLLTA